MPLPEAIDGDSGEKRVFRSRQPVGERLDPPVAEVDLRRGQRPTGLDRMVLLGPVRVATGQDVAGFERLFRIDLDGPERGHGPRPAPTAAGARLVELPLQF